MHQPIFALFSPDILRNPVILIKYIFPALIYVKIYLAYIKRMIFFVALFLEKIFTAKAK